MTYQHPTTTAGLYGEMVRIAEDKNLDDDKIEALRLWEELKAQHIVGTYDYKQIISAYYGGYLENREDNWGTIPELIEQAGRYKEQVREMLAAGWSKIATMDDWLTFRSAFVDTPWYDKIIEAGPDTEGVVSAGEIIAKTTQLMKHFNSVHYNPEDSRSK